jgi:Fic family protein
VFVLPGLVHGTLLAGREYLAQLDSPFERAAYTMFLVAEAHPFDDGNGRLARIMMNAELVAGAQSRIIIPAVCRDDYLGGLRLLTRQGNSGIRIKALRYGQDYTARIDFTSLEGATETFRATSAFHEPGSAERLALPPTA